METSNGMLFEMSPFFLVKDSHLVGYTQETHLKWLRYGYDLVKIAMC